MPRLRIFLQALLCLLLCQTTYAAFPVTTTQPVENSAPIAGRGMQFYKKSNLPAPPIRRANNKSRVVAALLCLLVFIWLPGIQRLYLGYTTQGIIQLSALILALLGSLAIFGAFAVGASAFAFFVIGVTLISIAIGLIGWHVIDFFRICVGSLRPKDGDYY